MSDAMDDSRWHDLMQRARLHAEPFMKNGFRNGDPVLLAELVDGLKQRPSATEYELVVAHSIVFATGLQSALGAVMDLMEMTCQCTHATVRGNVAITAKRLIKAAHLLDDSDQARVRGWISQLAQDQNERVRKNIEVA